MVQMKTKAGVRDVVKVAERRMARVNFVHEVLADKGVGAKQGAQ